MDKSPKLMYLLVYAVNLILLSTCCFGESDSTEKQLKITIAGKTYTLLELKKQFKTIRVIIPHNPAYNNQKKTYDAFDMNQILTKLMGADLQKKNTEQILLAQTLDKYVSQTPLLYFTTKGQAYLAYQEAPDTISDNNITKDGRWSYINQHGKKENPGPFYIVWNNTSTYPTSWPYQVISIQIVNKKELTFSLFLNPLNESESVKNGHHVFNNLCSPCHSLFYKGAQGRAPDLGMVTSYLTPSDISKLVKNGRGYMPPIGKNLSPKEINDLIEFLAWVNKQSSKLKCEMNN
ncbi:TPA: cytochrome c [Legionella pneumophila]|nr:cytochrome c [Legionella pneumophila]HDV5805727.1 cytochrome c [Legionella pneumophila]